MISGGEACDGYFTLRLADDFRGRVSQRHMRCNEFMEPATSFPDPSSFPDQTAPGRGALHVTDTAPCLVIKGLFPSQVRGSRGETSHSPENSQSLKAFTRHMGSRSRARSRSARTFRSHPEEFRGNNRVGGNHGTRIDGLPQAVPFAHLICWCSFFPASAADRHRLTRQVRRAVDLGIRKKAPRARSQH